MGKFKNGLICVFKYFINDSIAGNLLENTVDFILKHIMYQIDKYNLVVLFSQEFVKPFAVSVEKSKYMFYID